MRQISGWIAAVVVLSGLTVDLAWGQATVRGEVHGTVVDVTTATVPDAEVVLRNVGTNISRPTRTAASGFFVFPLVDPGFYQITVRKEGFQEAVVEQFQVTTQAAVLINVRLQVGKVDQQIVVRADTEVLNTREASVSSLITKTELTEIPLNEKQYVNLIRLEPGVVPGTITTGSSFGRDAGNGGYIHGKRFWDNTTTIDGGPYWDPFIPNETISSLLHGPGVSHEAIAEFRMYGNNPPPSEGFTYGGRMNVTTKSGGNMLHGAAYYYLRNDALDARSYFDTEKPPLKRHLFGGSLGGPLRPDRTFFYGNYEGMRQRKQETRVPLVPTPTLLAAIPSGASNGYLREILEQVYPTPAPGSFGPTDLFAPFSTTADLGLDYDTVLVRIDHRIREKHQLAARYLLNQAAGAFGVVFASGVPASDVAIQSRWQQQIVNLTSTISPKTLNEFRFSYHRQFNDFPTRETPPSLVQCCGFTASPTEPTSLPTILAVGTGLALLGPLPGLPQFRTINFFQVNDTVSSIRGVHSLKVGFDLATQNMNDFFPQDIRPLAVFIGFGPPFDASPFGLTTGTFLFRSATVPVNPPTQLRRIRRRQVAFHFQDTWQLRSNLTLDLGLRYELVGRPFETDGLMNNLFAADSSGNAIPNQPISDISAVTLQQVGCSNCPSIYRFSKRNFAPRVGISWNPFPNTVVRGGYGIQYGLMFFNLLSFNRLNPPFSRGIFQFGEPFGSDFLAAPSATPQIYTYDPALDRPYYIEWNVSVQQLIAEKTYVQVQYVANRGKKLLRPFTPNFGSGFAGARPNPDFARIVHWRTASSTWYDALLVQLNRRLSRGLGLNLSYTWAKAQDEASGETVAFGDFNFQSDPANPHVDKGPADFDMTHVFTANFVYELPFGSKRRFGSAWSGATQALLGGWQISGIATLHSGQRLTFFSGLDNNGDGNTNDRARALAPFDLLFDRSGLGPTQFFNPAAIGVEISATSGTILGRNSHRGPNFRSLDFSAKKELALNERVRLDFRAEFFNILNHTNFDQPVSTVTSPAFGVITATRNPGRQVQLMTKISF